MINSQTYCSHAFTSYDNRMRSVCCRAVNHSPVDSYDHTFRHPEIQKLRQDLISGIKNSICEVCWRDEAVGLESTRQKSLIGKNVYQIQNEIQNPRLRWIWIDPGNYCNLSCRTCYPTFSTSLGVEWSKRYQNRNIMMVKKPDLSPIVTEDLSAIETVMVIGGEPFLNLEHLDLLHSIVAQGNSHNCSVIYVTNNSKKIPEPIQNFLADFKKIRIILSIDAIDKPFDYIRTGGNWHEFEQNFSYLTDLKTRYSNLEIAFNITIGALNVLYLNKLYSWIQDHSGSDQITTAFVEGADQYMFGIFSYRQKQQLIENLRASPFPLDYVIDMIIKSQFDVLSLEKFWQDAEWTKSFHKLDIVDYLPELIDLIKQG